MINILRKIGDTEKIVCKVADNNAVLKTAIMGINELVIDVTVDTVLDIGIGDYVIIESITYTLNRDAEFDLRSVVECNYTITFEHPLYKLLDKLYQHKITKKTSFTLTGRLTDFVQLLIWCMNKTDDNPLGVDSGWTVGTIPITGYKTITFDSMCCRDVLTTLSDEYEVEFYLNNKEINFLSHIENETGLIFEQGKGGGLYTISQKNVDTENAITRIYPLGGTQNVPNKNANADGRLVLPEMYLENFSEYSKVVERCIVFDDIHPSFIGKVSSVSGDYDRVISCPEINFDISEVAVGDEARINFLTGDLMGKSFVFKWDDEEKKITLIRQEDDIALPDEDGNKPLIPNDSKKAKVTDEFNFTGLIMPEEYTVTALNDLRKIATEWLEFYCRKRLKFELTVDHRYLRGKRELKPGDLITIQISSHGIDKLIRITRVEKNLHTGELTCTVSNYLDEKWEKKIEGQISSIQTSIHNGSGNNNIFIIEQYDERPCTDKNVFSSLRSIKEIKDRSISRIYDDSADGHIIFKKGSTVENGLIVRLPKQNTEAALVSCLLEEDIDMFIEEDEDAVMEIAPAEATGDMTLGGLMNTDPSWDTLADEVYSMEVRDGMIYPKQSGSLVIGETAGTAYDGGAGAALEQLVRELAGGAGTIYSVYVRNNLESLGFASQYGEKCMLDFTFISQYRDNLSEPYKPTGELGLCTIMMKNSKFVDFTVVKQMEISSNVSVKQDVAEWLTSGSNSIKVTIKGENTDKTTNPVTYTVQLTSLGISAPNFAWWTAFAGDIAIPMIVNGNISKMLHVTITGDNYHQSYSRNLGTAVYLDTPYIYTLAHPGTTGVYKVSFYLSNSDNTIQTNSVSVNIMCIATAGQPVKLMCVNNVADLLTNWQDNKVFDYAIYDGSSAQTDTLFSIAKNGTEIYSSENATTPTNVKNTFTFPMEVETDDDANFDVIVFVTSGSDLIEPIVLNVNNSLGYSATTGAVLYINPKTRSNSQTNFRHIVNEVDKSIISVTWNNLNWGNDGWFTDDDGVKALKIFARSSAVIDYQPFATESARKGKTIEIDFKVENASDASKNIITIAEGNIGLKVSGENISFFSQSEHESSTQDVPTDNGVRIRLTVVIMPDAYGNAGFNIVAIYINGKKNRQYAYQSNDYFKNNGKITLGNDYANLYLYGLRVYDSALSSEAVQKNYINQLATTDEKQTEKSINQVLDGEGVNIDFNATKMLYNVFVVDKPFPSLMNPSGVAGNLEVFFKDRPERNFTLTNLLVEGQGTSSKKYMEWNIRFKLKGLKNADGNKINSIATYADGTTDKNCVLMFEGVPKSGRLTAKKNWASSMQDHKAGCVAAYNDLYKEIGLKNEAMIVDPQIRVAVYQEPFIGFSKSMNEEGQDVYTCMGEFTFGPDKGDDLCFGYDTEAYPALLSVEGSDNAPLGALFRVPWNRSKSYWLYNGDEEAFQYNNTNCWDFDAGELNADETEPLSAHRWIDAYNAVYVCNNRIKPFNGTLSELNNAVSEYRSTGYEYWIAKAGDANLYNLYYYEAAEGRFIPSDIGNGTINLRMQLAAYLASDLSAFTVDQLNELFINSRSQLFRATIPTYFDINDAVFHHNFVEFTAGTDQRAKNTYPYNFCTVGSKWRWRLDDADTIFPIDNQGQDRKPYYCEMHDFYDNGQAIWNGETSVFWNMLELAFSSEITAGMRKIFAAMESLCGQPSGTPYDKAYAFYKKYFLSIKEHFPATLVNADAKRYEIAKIAYENGSYSNDTDPITQSHGDFYSAETAWVKKRIMYIMSKYSYGLFSANGTDTIIVRAAGDLIDYEITPAFDMYPAIANGTSIVSGERTKAGETCRITIDLGGSADQQNAIQAASWLLSIGDWHLKNVSGTMVVRGRRLAELVLGSKTDDVTISITGLTLADCGSMQKILLSNIATLQGTLDLSAIVNIREVYADGTNLSQIKLPNGGGLEVIEYPANNKYLTFRNFPMLTTEGLRIGQCTENITDFLIENCPKLNPVQLLSTIIGAQQSQGTNHVLKHIRAVGFEEEYYTADALDMLAQLADGTYEGLSAEGLAGEDPVPVLDGTITLHSNYYQDSVDALRGIFNKLDLIMNGKPAIRFADPEVLNLLTTSKAYINYVSSSNPGNLLCVDRDSDGMITIEEVAQVRSLSNRSDGSSSILMGNTIIETFNEFRFFTGLNIINSGCFQNCSSLKEITLPMLTNMGDNVFSNTGIERLIIPEGYQFIGKNILQNCHALILVDFPSTVTSIAVGGNLFWNMANQPTVVCRAITPPSFGSWGYGCNPNAIYVPDSSVNAYKTATNWNSQSSKIYPLSQYIEIQ